MNEKFSVSLDFYSASCGRGELIFWAGGSSLTPLLPPLALPLPLTALHTCIYGQLASCCRSSTPCNPTGSPKSWPFVRGAHQQTSPPSGRQMGKEADSQAPSLGYWSVLALGGHIPLTLQNPHPVGRCAARAGAQKGPVRHRPSVWGSSSISCT